MKSSLSIVIPTFNGLDLLKKNLPTIVKHAATAEVIVVNDDSTDQTLSWIHKNFPQIRVISHKKNLGFVASVNHGFSQAGSELVLLLNNDVSIQTDTIENLLPHFKNKKVFAVGALEVLPNGGKRGKSIGKFKRGLVVHDKASDFNFGKTFWVFGASGMFRRQVFLKLSGMDEVYRPAYWEDIDLSYRAWKAGFICLFEPKSSLLHQTEVSMNKALGPRKTMIGFKNQILFTWKNITDFDLKLLHALWLPYHLIITTFRTKGAFLFGFVLACWQISELGLVPNRYPEKLRDKQIFKELE